MADIVSAAIRSRMMAGIKSKNTKPEMLLRSGLHRLGFRFRLHDRRLPGTPDMVLRRHNAVILIHGCFWHGHDCHLFRIPATRTDFWQAKITRNKELDHLAVEALISQSWRVGIVWECALKGRARIALEDVLAICSNWLESDSLSLEIRGN
ncbi:very short patch repair endonuclease [Novosphingobium huizhouense]|uniref:very short patch repair endonuclease n=1 Tax=Novosphingobium huizhouense TaxID=2866625 RepID=UPI001CD82BC1|nr:DNA mismatch endonuclease Vsr [Novosphingobium huizhouense]